VISSRRGCAKDMQKGISFSRMEESYVSCHRLGACEGGGFRNGDNQQCAWLSYSVKFEDDDLAPE
jgi:hypothetical protein